MVNFMHGIGNSADYFMIEDAAKRLGLISSYECSHMRNECMRIAEGHPVGLSHNEVLYAGLAGYFWGMDKGSLEKLKAELDKHPNHLSEDGRFFVSTIINGSIKGNLNNSCPILVNIVERAISDIGRDWVKGESTKGADSIDRYIHSGHANYVQGPKTLQ